MDLISKYGFALGVRYFSKQKLKYAKEVSRDLKGSVMNFQVVKKPLNKKMHIYINRDIKNKYILLSPYNTLTKTYSKNYKYYPLNQDKQIKYDKKELYYQILIALSLLIIGISLIMFSSAFKIVMYVISAILVIGSLFILSGVPNKLNLNRHSLSNILIIQRIMKDKNNKAILYDGNLKDIADKIKQSECPIIIDSISKGDIFIYHRNKENEVNTMKKILEDYNIKVKIKTDKNDLYDQFDQYIYLVAGKEDEESDIYIEDTRSNRDRNMNSNNLEAIDAAINEIV